MSTLRAEVLTTEPQVVAITDRWESLRRSLEASPFVGPTLYTAWLGELGHGHQPFVVVVREGDRLCAVAPWTRRGPLVYSVPGHVKVAGELLVDESRGVDAWLAVLSAAFSRRGVLAVDVPHATDDDTGESGARAASERLGLPYSTWPRFRRYLLRPAEGTFEAHTHSWSRNRRAKVAHARRRLERLGTAGFRAVPAVDGYDTLREIHRRQWRADRTIGWVHTEAGARIDRRLIGELPATILLLELDGRAIGAALWFDTGGQRTALYLTRDPRIQLGSPGQLLHVELVRRAYEDGVRLLDLMGRGGDKDRLGLEVHTGYEVAVGRPAIAGRALVGLRGLHLRARRGQ